MPFSKSVWPEIWNLGLMPIDRPEGVRTASPKPNGLKLGKGTYLKKSQYAVKEKKEEEMLGPKKKKKKSRCPL